jgi:hypothetical protein
MKLQINEVSIPKSFSLVGGDESINQHFSMDKSKAELLSNHKENARSENFVKVKNTLENLVQKSLVQQENRMILEEDFGYTRIEDSDNKQMLKEAQNKLQKELNKVSNNKSGILTFLDYTKKKTNLNVYSIDPAPFHPKSTIDKLLAKNQTDTVDEVIDETKQDDCDQVDASNAKMPPKGDRANNVKIAKNNLLSGATQISTTAKYMLQDIETGKISVRDPIGTTLDVQWFSSLQITTLEKRFYEERTTPIKVLQLLAAEYDSSEKWELFPLETLSEADKQRISDVQQKHNKQIEHASKISTSFLVPLAHNIDSNEQIIEYGHGATALTNARSKNPATAKHIMSQEF